MTENDPIAKVPGGTNNLILYVAAGFGALLIVASVVLGIGENVENKLTLFKWAAGAAATVLSVALGAMGYSTAKLLEGVVPIGFMPAAKAVAQTLPTATATLIGEPLKPFERGTSEVDPSKIGGPIPRVPPLLLLLPLLGLFCGGCVGTSAQFQHAIPAGVNNVVQDMREYTNAANWDTNHDGMVDAQESALTDALAQSVADPAKVTVEGVESNWIPVQPRWRNYIANDPILITDDDRKIRNDTGDLINSLIAKEKERQAALRKSLGLFGG
jgi:hypothetical protein